MNDLPGNCLFTTGKHRHRGGVKPFRSRSYSVDRYGFDGACKLGMTYSEEAV